MYNYRYQKEKGIGISIFILCMIIYLLFQLIKRFSYLIITGILIITLIVLWFWSKKKKAKRENAQKLIKKLEQDKEHEEVVEFWENLATKNEQNKTQQDIKEEGRKVSKQSGTERILKKAFDKVGLDVTPQYKISKMTVDFAIPKKKIIIEVDGPLHNEIGYKKQDGRRDYILKKMGWDIWRIKVEKIDNNVDKVVDEILKRLNKK